MVGAGGGQPDRCGQRLAPLHEDLGRWVSATATRCAEAIRPGEDPGTSGRIGTRRTVVRQAVGSPPAGSHSPSRDGRQGASSTELERRQLWPRWPRSADTRSGRVRTEHLPCKSARRPGAAPERRQRAAACRSRSLGHCVLWQGAGPRAGSWRAPHIATAVQRRRRWSRWMARALRRWLAVTVNH